MPRACSGSKLRLFVGLPVPLCTYSLCLGRKKTYKLLIVLLLAKDWVAYWSFPFRSNGTELVILSPPRSANNHLVCKYILFSSVCHTSFYPLDPFHLQERRYNTTIFDSWLVRTPLVLTRSFLGTSNNTAKSGLFQFSVKALRLDTKTGLLTTGTRKLPTLVKGASKGSTLLTSTECVPQLLDRPWQVKPLRSYKSAPNSSYLTTLQYNRDNTT